MRKLVLIFSFLLFGFLSKAQYAFDFGGGIGVANYLGDVGGNGTVSLPGLQDLKVADTKIGIGGFARRVVFPFLSARLNMDYVMVTGDDKDAGGINRRNRNLSFRTHIVEATLDLQYFAFEIRNIFGQVNDIKFYIFAGVGTFLYIPTAQYNGSYVSLRPLKTEGVAYGNFAYCFPVGFGIDYSWLRRYRIGIEFGYRKTTTDYIDDVSDKYGALSDLGSDPIAASLSDRTGELTTPLDPVYRKNFGPGNKRGNPDDNDAYFLTKLNFSYILRGKSSFYKSHFGHRFKGSKKRKFRAKF